MARRLDDDAEEMSAIEQMEAERVARDVRAGGWTQATVANVEGWRANAPWVRADAVVGLAKAGIAADSENGRKVATAAAKTKSRKRGLGWHSVGDFVDAAAEKTGDVASDVATAAGTGIRGVTRGVTTGLLAPAEWASALYRDQANRAASGGQYGVGIAGASGLGLRQPQATDQTLGDIADQTTLGQAASQAARGEKVDLGRGFLPGGTAAAAQAEAARSAAPTIGGAAFTVGRALANVVTEPGTTPYNVLSGLVDASVAIALDPSAIALKGVSNARKTRNLFVAGGVDGTRKTTLPEVVASWKESPDGVKVREWMAETDDFQSIWTTTDRKIPVRTVAQLRKAKTVPEVDAILDDVLGITIREQPVVGFGKVGGVRGAVRRRTDTVRLLQQMPGHSIPVDDLDAAVLQLDRVQKNYKLDRATISANNQKLAEATSPQAVYDVVINDVLGGAKGALVARGVPEATARRLTRAWSGYHEELSRYFVDEIGENAHVPGVILDGAGQAIPSPHLYVEYLNSAIPLPDARDIRRATSSIGRLTGKADYTARLPVATADFLMAQVWKPLILLRGAWTTRVIGEEQVRMAAAGLSNVFTHPLSHIAGMLGKGKTAGNANVGITGDVLRETVEGQAALSRGSAGWTKPRGAGIATRYKTVYEKGDDAFLQSWGDEIAQLHADPIASRLAGGLRPGDRLPGDATGVALTDVKRWFGEGAGRKFRDDLAVSDARFNDPAFADQYIDSVMDRIRIKTGGRQDLIDAIGSGKLGKANVGDAKFARALGAFEDAAPVKVKGDLRVPGSNRPGAQVSESLDRATEAMFNALMSRPTNALSRSPAFKSFFWKRMGEMMPALDPAAQAKVLDNARAAKLPANILDDLTKRAKLGTGDLAAADVDVIAKGFGLDETRKLLYDLSNRSQLFDITRNIFPFGEAWKELLTTWARIGVENPQVVRRGQQVIEGARGAGFFYENEYGDEVFAYPGSAWVSDKLIGVPVPLTGRVAGLSLMTEVLPGVGPVVQIPAGAIIPETPAWDDFRELISPFGERDEEGGFVESFLPPWVQKLKTTGYFADLPFGGPSGEQQRLLGNTAIDVMRYQITSGDVARPETPEEMTELYEDAMDRARILYLFRGAAQFGAPTAPTPEAVAADKDGRLMVAQVMVNRLYELQQDEAGGGYETAFDRFLDEFGPDAFILAQPKSSSLVYNAPVTTDGVEWQKAHPKQAKAFPNTYGLFAPDTGEFDPTAYARQFRTGEKASVTPQLALQLANNRLAAYLYDQAKSEVSDRPSAEERKWLRDYKAALTREFHGYGDQPGLPRKAQLPTVIAELERAVQDPTLRRTDAGQAIRTYMEVRAEAQADAEAAGLASFTTAKAMLPTRDWLRDMAAALNREHPSFVPIWEQVFERELADDDPEEP